MTPERKLKYIDQRLQENGFRDYCPARTYISELIKSFKEKDAQIADLEKRLKEISEIAVDLGGGK